MFMYTVYIGKCFLFYKLDDVLIRGWTGLL